VKPHQYNNTDSLFELWKLDVVLDKNCKVLGVFQQRLDRATRTHTTECHYIGESEEI